MKIFYLGLPMCGSTSLAKALNILGFKSLHYQTEDNVVFQDVLKENIKNDDDPLKGFEEYDAFLEFRGYNYIHTLIKAYPDAKFIASTRDYDSWLESVKNHHRPRGLLETDQYYADLYEEASENIQLMIDAEYDNFLHFDYTKNRWNQLCAFLNKPFPVGVKYPHYRKSKKIDETEYDIVITSLPDMDKDKPAPGPAYLKSYLEQHGKKVKTIDGNQLGSIQEVVDKINQYKFKWLGVSVFSYMQQDAARELGKHFGDNIIYGGAGVTNGWHEKNYITGEGEVALLEFLNGNHFYPGINGRPPQQLKDISSLPPPDFSDYLEEHDYLQIQVTGSRGCVRNCTFCDIKNTWDKFTFVDGETLADNMHRISEQTGIKTIAFTDSLVNGSMKQFRQLCAALAKKETKINWHGQFIARRKETFTEADFDNLANSGCVGLTIGIESGSEQVRDHMRKKFSNDDIEWFVTNIAKRGIGMKFLLIVGYPTETRKDFEDTKALIKKYVEWKNQISLSIDIMRIEPNTPIETDHHDVFEGHGHDWWNGNTTLEKRFEWFIELFEYAESLGYSFPHHAHAKKERFTKYLIDPSSVVL